jgi:hypothetical protein
MRGSALLCLSLFAPTLVAQSADWGAVRSIPVATPISVKAWRNTTCLFQAATDEQLFCDPLPDSLLLPRSLPDDPEIVFNRRDIRQIRREFTRETRGHLGAAIGAGVGAAVGAAAHDDKSGYTRGGTAIVAGLAGGCAGWIVASNAPIFHRRLIYKR